MFTRKYTDEIYNRFNEPGFDWMGEEGFYKAVHVIAKDLEEAGNEVSDSFFKEVASNIVLQARLNKAVIAIGAAFAILESVPPPRHESSVMLGVAKSLKEIHEELGGHPVGS